MCTAGRSTVGVLEQEPEQLDHIFKSPAGEDIKENNLTSTSFPNLVAEAETIAPNFCAVLFRLARTENQQKRNPAKNPATVSLFPTPKFVSFTFSFEIILVVIAMSSYTLSHNRGRLQKLFLQFVSSSEGYRQKVLTPYMPSDSQ